MEIRVNCLTQMVQYGAIRCLLSVSVSFSYVTTRKGWETVRDQEQKFSSGVPGLQKDILRTAALGSLPYLNNFYFMFSS